MRAFIGSVVAICTLVFGGGARGAVLHVDAANPNCPGTGTISDPFCTIQAAIVAALNGDTVTVAPGTYVENVAFLGKAIILESSGGPAATTIDGSLAGPCVSFVGFEGRSSVLRGFRLVNGGGTFLLPGPGGFDDYGGLGVLCFQSSPTIEGNLIEAQADGTKRVFGAGIYSASGSPLVTGNVIRDNDAYQGAGFYALGGSPELFDNEITGHDAEYGAGIHIEGCADPRLVDNDIHDNGSVFFGFNSGPGPGANFLNSTGVDVRDNRFERNFGTSGGVTLENCSGTLADNAFVDNAVEFEGGGIAVWLCNGLTIARNTFEGNGGFSGAAVYVLGGTGVVIADCRARDNTCAGMAAIEVSGPHAVRRTTATDGSTSMFVAGNGFAITGTTVVEDCLSARNDTGILVLGGTPTVRRCTVTESAFAGIEVLGGAVQVDSTILWGNGIIGGDEIHEPFGVATVRNSVVEGGFAGTGVIALDPLFVNAAAEDYRLQPTSPCIDAGFPTDTACGVDLDGGPRRVSGALTKIMRVDMGALEFRHVALAVTETAPLTYQFDATGTAGLATILFASVAPASICAPPAGTLLVDLSQPASLVLPWAPLPSSIPVGAPSGVTADVWFQLAALGPSPGTANFSNPAVIHLGP